MGETVYVKVTLPDFAPGRWLITRLEDALDDVRHHVQEEGPGNRIVIEPVDMTEEEIAALPAFTGW